MTDRLDQASSPSTPATEPSPDPEPAPSLPTPPATTEDAALEEDAALDQVRALCPYLIAADGDWRSLAPTREHRCAAVDPWTPVAPDKQRRLCLVAGHLECSTYLAARRVLVLPEEPEETEEREKPATTEGATLDVAAPETAPGDGRAADLGTRADLTMPTATAGFPSGRWPVPMTAPVVIGRSRGGLASVRLDRSLAQAGLVALMVLAFVVLAVARLSGDGGPAAPASPTPMATAGASPSSGGSGDPTMTPVPTVSAPSAPASAIPSPSIVPPSAASPTSYRVRAGDTLSAIAIRFGTTVAVLTDLNDIADPGALRVGQVLRLP